MHEGARAQDSRSSSLIESIYRVRCSAPSWSSHPRSPRHPLRGDAGTKAGVAYTSCGPRASLETLFADRCATSGGGASVQPTEPRTEVKPARVRHTRAGLQPRVVREQARRPTDSQAHRSPRPARADRLPPPSKESSLWTPNYALRPTAPRCRARCPRPGQDSHRSGQDRSAPCRPVHSQCPPGRSSDCSGPNVPASRPRSKSSPPCPADSGRASVAGSDVTLAPTGSAGDRLVSQKPAATRRPPDRDELVLAARIRACAGATHTPSRRAVRPLRLPTPPTASCGRLRGMPASSTSHRADPRRRWLSWTSRRPARTRKPRRHVG